MSGSALSNEHAASGETPHALPSIGVVVVAAGRGERLGAGVPKAFTVLGDRTLLEHSARTILTLPHQGQLVMVVPRERAPEALMLSHLLSSEHPGWRVSVVSGGRERHESVRFGLASLHDSIDTVLVHDAARPLASAALFDRVIGEVRRAGCSVIPVLPVVDTHKRVDDGEVRETVDREPLVAVQTPQGFPLEVLAAAHGTAALQDDETELQRSAPTDDAEVVQRAGGTVRTVPGEARAHKLTTPFDLRLLETVLGSDSCDERESPDGREGVAE